MRILRTAASVLLCCVGAGERHAEALSEPSSVRAEELGGTIQVIGKLQQPIGTVVQIEATIVDGETLRMKQYEGAYLLRVESVAGKRLAGSPVLRFEPSGSGLAADSLALYESKHGKKPGPLSSDEIRELKKGYVGQRLTLLVYETGAFGGIPKNLPPELIWQDTAFEFSTRLVVLKRIAAAR